MDIDPVEQAKEQQPGSSLSAGVEQAILQLKNGDTALASRDSDREGAVEHPGGTIFLEDMPTLQEVLSKLDVITAVIDRPGPRLDAVEVPGPQPGTTINLSRPAVLVVGGIPVSVTVLGLWMLISAIAGSTADVNPYIALFLFLGGLVLGATAWLGLSEN